MALNRNEDSSIHPITLEFRDCKIKGGAITIFYSNVKFVNCDLDLSGNIWLNGTNADFINCEIKCNRFVLNSGIINLKNLNIYCNNKYLFYLNLNNDVILDMDGINWNLNSFNSSDYMAFVMAVNQAGYTGVPTIKSKMCKLLLNNINTPIFYFIRAYIQSNIDVFGFFLDPSCYTGTGVMSFYKSVTGAYTNIKHFTFIDGSLNQ